MMIKGNDICDSMMVCLFEWSDNLAVLLLEASGYYLYFSFIYLFIIIIITVLLLGGGGCERTKQSLGKLQKAKSYDSSVVVC